MAVPYTFGTATASIPLSQLDSNFATVITLGNTAIQLGNTVTTLNNMTLANVTISSGNITLTNYSATTANITTANVGTLIVTGNETVQGNTSVTGTATASKFIPTGNSATGNGMYLPATNSVGISTNGTNAVYIDASQNVGIGQSTPTVKLDVNGATNFGGTSGVRCGVGTAFVGGQAEVYSQGAVPLGVGTASTQPLRFYTNSTLAATIDSSGYVSVNSAAAVSQFNVQTTVAGTPVAFFNHNAASGTATSPVYIRKYDNSNTTAQTYAAFQYNQGSGGAGGIQGNGASGVQFFSSSDARLKENIVELDSQLANIMALKPSKFDFIEGPKNCTGFIAQEMEQVYPDAVNETPDGYKTIGGVSIMETRLIKCIQEQQALITQLTDRIAALEAK